MSDHDVYGYLQSKALPLKRAGQWEFHTACVFCGEDPSKRGRLYINTDPGAEIPGLFFCHKCGQKGNLITLKRFFGDPINDGEEVPAEQRYNILQAAANYYHEKLINSYVEVIGYLRGPKRGLTLETIIEHKIGYAPQEFESEIGKSLIEPIPANRLFSHLRELGFATADIKATGLVTDRDGKVVDALVGMITIPYLSGGSVVAIRGRSWPFDAEDWDSWPYPRYDPPEMKYKTTGGGLARIYNTDVMYGEGEGEVCITEGEFDTLILKQLGFPSVAVPGATAWKDSWTSYFNDMKNVWLVYDRDEAGETASKKIQEKLGARARRLFLSPEGQKKDPTQWVSEGHTAEEFAELIAAGRRTGMLLTVNDAIDEFVEIQGRPGMKFGIDLLDLMIEPGMQPTQVGVFLAKTGTGKTIMMLNLMHRVRMVPGQENFNFLFLSLEQTRGEWWDRARRIYRFYNLEDTDEDCAGWWENNIRIVDRNRVTEEQVYQVLEEYEASMGGLPDMIIIDYLGYYANSYSGERYDRVSNAIMGVKKIAKDTKTRILLPHQVSRIGKDGEEFGSDAARDSGVIEETADFLFTIWMPDNQLGKNDEERNGKIHLRIGKSRHGGRGIKCDFQWGPLSLVMVPVSDPHVGMAMKEFDWKQRYHDNWEKGLYRHITGFDGVLNSTPKLVERADNMQQERLGGV